MKKLWKIGILFTSILVIALAFPITVSAAPLEDDRTVFGSSYTLESGRILDGDLNVFGGVVNVEEDAAVTGDMFVLGGLVNINGTIEGNLTVLGGTVTLGSDAVIEGDLFAPGSYLDQEEGAEVRGDLVESWDVPWSEEFDFPFFFQPDIIRSPQTRLFSIVTSIGRGIALTLVLVALGALLLLAIPKPVETMTDALMKAPWHILGYGALTALDGCLDESAVAYPWLRCPDGSCDGGWRCPPLTNHLLDPGRDPGWIDLCLGDPGRMVNPGLYLGQETCTECI